MQLIQEHQIRDLNTHHRDQGDKDSEHFAQTGVVSWCILFTEEEGTDDVAGGRAGVVEGHDDGLFSRAACVSDDPGDDERVAAEEEGEEVVSN